MKLAILNYRAAMNSNRAIAPCFVRLKECIPYYEINGGKRTSYFKVLRNP
jgi:hypothetical protein